MPVPPLTAWLGIIASRQGVGFDPSEQPLHIGTMEDYREFLRRRMREEVQKAETEESEELRRLHWSWAGLYRGRLKSLDDSNPTMAA